MTVPLPDPLSATPVDPTPDIFFGNAERDNLLGKISDQQNQIDALQKKIDAHAGEHEQLQNSVRQQQLSVADSKKKINEQHDKIVELRGTVNELSRQLEEKDREIDRLKNVGFLLNNTIVKKDEEIFDLELKIHDLLNKGNGKGLQNVLQTRTDDNSGDDGDCDSDHATCNQNENNDDNPKQGGSNDNADNPDSSNIQLCQEGQRKEDLSNDSDDNAVNDKVDIARFKKFDEAASSDYLQDQLFPFLQHHEKLSKMGECLGKGKFGIVSRATFKGESVAVKRIFQMSLRDQCVELELSLKLCHENIASAKFYYLTQSEDLESQVNLVFPFMDRRDLRREYNTRNNNFTHYQSYKICFEVSKALQYLHDLNIVHRDIKPENIFISSCNKIQLGDFGLCLDFSKPIKTVQALGTLPYMSPELCTLRSKHGAGVDIWAMGVLFCELISAIDGAPYCFKPNLPQKAQMKCIRNFLYPDGLLNITDGAESYKLTSKQDFIVRQCLSKKVEDRPSAASLLNLFQHLPHELLF